MGPVERRLAIAAPMPREPPVTRAAFSDNRFDTSSFVKNPRT